MKTASRPMSHSGQQVSTQRKLDVSNVIVFNTHWVKIRY